MMVQKKIDLAILIYYSFISRKFRKWRGVPGFTVNTRLSEYLPIDFGQGITKKLGYFGDRSYFDDAFETIVTKWNISSTLPQEAQTIIQKQLGEIEDAIELINKNMYD